MRALLFILVVLLGFQVKAQFIAPFHGVQNQPKVQLDYWVYKTHAGNGSATQYPVVAASKADMDNIFNANNPNTTLVSSGRTNSTRILDWQNSTELNALGITAPNSGTYFAIKVQGTFIPLESGTYTFTLESDDASDLTFNWNTIISTYKGEAVPTLGTRTGSISLTAGQKYLFEARMQQGSGGYGIRMYWKSPSQASPSSYTSVHPVNTFYQAWTQNLQELVANPIMDGLTAEKAAPSAKYIQTAFSNFADGVYWINLPIVGPTQIYCLLNSAVNGGGWMMMMKATRGLTFNYFSSYWTIINTLNPTAFNRSDGDAKFDAMNYFYAKDIMALWPDIAWNANSSTTGGSVNTNGSYNVWCWLQNNFNNGIRITPINFFSSASKLFFGDAKSYGGWNGGVFSAQSSVRFYGFNYTNTSNAQVRWGFAWNENAPLALFPNGDEGSNDVSGGIGMRYGSYSAGDYVGCCEDNTGIKRTARVEIYVR